MKFIINRFFLNISYICDTRKPLLFVISFESNRLFQKFENMFHFSHAIFLQIFIIDNFERNIFARGLANVSVIMSDPAGGHFHDEIVPSCCVESLNLEALNHKLVIGDCITGRISMANVAETFAAGFFRNRVFSIEFRFQCVVRVSLKRCYLVNFTNFHIFKTFTLLEIFTII